MKIALINGSPKVNESASEYILKSVKSLIEEDNDILYYEINKPFIDEEQIEELYRCDALVLAFPLYVDSIPSHLLQVLTILQEYFNTKEQKNIMVYTLVNCGFYEGKQNAVAMEIMQHWTKRSGLVWGQGVGIGAGGMILSIKEVPNGHGPKKNIGITLMKLAANINNNKTGDNLVLNMNFPRFAYKLSAHMRWRKLAKRNGLKRRDLSLRK